MPRSVLEDPRPCTIFWFALVHCALHCRTNNISSFERGIDRAFELFLKPLSINSSTQTKKTMNVTLYRILCF